MSHKLPCTCASLPTSTDLVGAVGVTGLVAYLMVCPEMDGG